MHEVVNDVFGDLVEAWFDNDSGFVGVGMSYEYFTCRSVFKRGFEVVLANLGGHFIINAFDFMYLLSFPAETSFVVRIISIPTIVQYLLFTPFRIKYAQSVEHTHLLHFRG